MEQQLAEAVELLMDPGRCEADAAATAHANQFLADVRGSWDGLQLTLQVLAGTESAQVRFWCMQTVLKAVEGGLYSGLEPPQRGAVKRAIIAWVSDASRGAEPYVTNKCADVLVQIFLTGDWATFFHDIVVCAAIGHRALASHHPCLFHRVVF